MLRVTKELPFAFKSVQSLIKYSFLAGDVWFATRGSVTRLVNLHVLGAFCFSLTSQSVSESLY